MSGRDLLASARFWSAFSLACVVISLASFAIVGHAPGWVLAINAFSVAGSGFVLARHR